MRVEDVVDGYFFFSFFADVHGIYVVRILCTMYYKASAHGRTEPLGRRRAF